MFTGRDLIIYILANNLEDKPIYKDGKLLGFVNIYEAAAIANVGVNTIFAWLRLGRIEGVVIGGELFIPADFNSPLENVSL
jgi:uncharacterized membrane protein YjfL (UPF0719 family)